MFILCIVLRLGGGAVGFTIYICVTMPDEKKMVIKALYNIYGRNVKKKLNIIAKMTRDSRRWRVADKMCVERFSARSPGDT